MAHRPHRQGTRRQGLHPEPPGPAQGRWWAWWACCPAVCVCPQRQRLRSPSQEHSAAELFPWKAQCVGECSDSCESRRGTLPSLAWSTSSANHSPVWRGEGAWGQRRGASSRASYGVLPPLCRIGAGGGSILKVSATLQAPHPAGTHVTWSLLNAGVWLMGAVSKAKQLASQRDPSREPSRGTRRSETSPRLFRLSGRTSRAA